VATDIKSQTADELRAQFKAWDQPGYRVEQTLKWLYTHRVADWEAMTNLPKALREQLRNTYGLGTLALIRKQGARDTTQKFLWQLGDGSLIESVLIAANPALYGEPSDRHTLCVSTQVGCAYGCAFCASGLNGWKRNLGAEEIVDQVLAVERWNDGEGKRESEGQAPKPEADSNAGTAELESEPGTATFNAQTSARLVSNLVIMGMGEPLANYDNLMRALRIINAPWGGGIGARKITISTSGLAPQIRRLADEPLQFRLAI